MILKIDHRDIFVSPLSKADTQEVGGYFHGREGAIEIDGSVSPPEQAVLFLHELIHALWASRDMAPRPSEEQVCRKLAPALATVFRDNPGLGDVLDNALNHGVPIVGASII